MNDCAPNRSWPSLLLGALTMVLLINACVPSASDTVTPAMGTTVYRILRSGDPAKSIDIVFVPDDDYGDLSVEANRQTFYDDVDEVIRKGIYDSIAIHQNLPLFNFWYMLATGNVGAALPGMICPQWTWPDLTDAAFAELVLLLHPNALPAPTRDCGGNARASARAGAANAWVTVHEASHAAFSLPDEYCCDGGYWHAPPILYNSQQSCTSDASNAAWRDCASFKDKWGRTWWRSEGNIVDVMSAGGPPTHEYGQADWTFVSARLAQLKSTSWAVATPRVYAPTPWPSPTP